MAELKEARVPDIGGFDDVPVIEVLVAPGDTVEKDQGLVLLESDKATMEVPSPFAGVVKEIKVSVDDKVAEGALVATIEAGGDDAGDDGDQADGGKGEKAGAAGKRDANTSDAGKGDKGKAADTANDICAVSAAQARFDFFDQCIAFFNIDTGIFVTQGRGGGLLFAHRVGFARTEVSKKGRHSTSLSALRGVLMVKSDCKYRIRSLRSALLPVTMPIFRRAVWCSRKFLFHQDCFRGRFCYDF